MDVALGGEGAPLVPIGDKLLFGEYDYCLNLGGYSNISYQRSNKRIAFDICPVNKIINLLANQAGKEMDKNGEMAKNGHIIPEFLKDLNSLDYYSQIPPKSLGDTWLQKEFIPVLEKFSNYPVNDRLRTCYEHIAMQIQQATHETKGKKILATGGGAHNIFLMQCVQKFNLNQFIIPEKKLTDFKEALIFAFMGLLRVEKQVNCLSSVTGARKNNIGGVISQI